MGTRPLTEPDLRTDTIDGCRRGDPTAQRELFERYGDRVFSIALHYLRGDESAAKDVTQEVFVKLFRAIPTFRHHARLSTWLYRIVVNTCTDELRRRRRLVLFGDLPPAIHPVTVQHRSTEDAELVARAVRRLTPKLRMAVLLRYYDDLSYEEIAAALGVSAGTVASRLHRAHAILARDLAQFRPAQVPTGESNDAAEA